MSTLAAILAVLATVQYTSPAGPDDAFGVWLLEESGAHYSLDKCQGDRLCATVKKVGDKGDAAKRPKPVGATVITGAMWDGRAWKSDDMRLFGIVINGRKYDSAEATLTPTSGGLSVKGCIPLGCKTIVWKRVR
jgi:uncharacterized protein (DUF2147 family)